jgi:hypothetical protein
MSQNSNTKNESSNAESANSNVNGAAKKRPLVDVKSFNPAKLSFTPIDFTGGNNKPNLKAPAKDFKNLQFVAYSRYTYPKLDRDDNLIFLTPKVKITQHGIPMKGEFYKDDNSRSFVKLPFDPEQADCVTFETMVKSIDSRTLEQKDHVLGAKSDKYDYQPSVKVPAPVEDDDEEDAEKAAKNKLRKPKCNYMKIKLDKDKFNSDLVTTKVYLLEKDENGKAKHTPVDCKSITDLEKYFTFGCSVRMIVMLNKLWAAKSATPPEKLRKYGLGYKALQIEIEPSEFSSRESAKDQYSNGCAFGGGDDEETQEAEAAPVESKSNSTSKPTPTKDVKDDDAAEDDETGDGDGDGDEDEDEDEDSDGDGDDDDEAEEEVAPQQSKSKSKSSTTPSTPAKKAAPSKPAKKST